MEKQTEIKGDKNMKWEIDGEQVIAFVNDHAYYCTNNHSEGIFYVDQIKNTRRQLAGTCQFSVRGLKRESKKSKLRRWIAERKV